MTLRYTLVTRDTEVQGTGYSSLLKSVAAEGYKWWPRGLATREVQSLIYTLPLGSVEERVDGNPAIGIVEGIGVLANVPWLEVFNALKKVAPKTVTNGMFEGAMSDYAGRLRGFPFDLTRTNTPERLPIHRQAVGMIARHGEYAKSLPCTLAVQLIERYDTLDLHVFMRSQDLFLGLPADTMLWTVVGTYYAAYTGLKLGKLIFHVSAAHIYEKHIGRIDTPVFTREYHWGVPIVMPSNLQMQLYVAKGKNWIPTGLVRTPIHAPA